MEPGYLMYFFSPAKAISAAEIERPVLMYHWQSQGWSHMFNCMQSKALPWNKHSIGELIKYPEWNCIFPGIILRHVLVLMIVKQGAKFDNSMYIICQESGWKPNLDILPKSKGDPSNMHSPNLYISDTGSQVWCFNDSRETINFIE